METANLFRKSVFLKVIFVLTALFACVNLQAIKTITVANFNGSNNITVPALQPNTIQVNVTVVTGGDNTNFGNYYESLGYKIGNRAWQCASPNIFSHTAAGTYAKTFNINIPALPNNEIVDVSFRAYNNEYCIPYGNINTAVSAVFTLKDAVIAERLVGGTKWSRDRIYWGDAESTSAIIECDFSIHAANGNGLLTGCNGPITRKIAGYYADGTEYNAGYEIAPTLALGPAFDADGNMISELRMYAWDWSWMGESKEGKIDVGWAGIGNVPGGGGIRYLDSGFDRNTYWTRLTNLTTPMISTGTSKHWQWFGGEVNQKTGELYMSGGYYIDSRLNCMQPTGNCAANNIYSFNQKVGILDPATNTFKGSGVLTPKTPYDELPGASQVVSDMAIDAEGNFYLMTAQYGDMPRVWWLIKVSPKRDSNKKIVNGADTTNGTAGTNGWEYTKVVSFPEFSTTNPYDYFGLSFFDGKLYLGGGAGGTVGCNGGYYCVVELNPLFGEFKLIGKVPTPAQLYGVGGSAIRDFATAQMAPVISGNIYIDANNDGIVTESEKEATKNIDMSGFELHVFQNGAYIGNTKTSYGGEYSLMLPSRNATFHVRLKQPQLDGANVKQTWASGGRYAWTRANSPGNNTVTPTCYNDPSLSAKQNAVYNQVGLYPGDEYDYWEVNCVGVRADGIDGSANTISAANYITRVTIETDMAVARANFAVGLPDRSDSPSSFGDASLFVLKDNNIDIANSIYLGESVTADKQSIFDNNANKDDFDDGVKVKRTDNASADFVTIQDYEYENKRQYTFRVYPRSFDNSTAHSIGYLHGWMSLANSANTTVGDYSSGLKIVDGDTILTGNASYYDFNYTIPDKEMKNDITGNKSKAYVRFRFVTENVSLGATNPGRNSAEANTQPWAIDGEVEDYMVTYYYYYKPPIPEGNFIVVNKNFNKVAGSRFSPLDSSNPELALYTQVVDKPFDVKLVYHENGLILPRFEQAINGTVDFIEIPSDKITTYTQESVCKTLTALQTKVWGNNGTSETVLTATGIKLGSATKTGTFRVNFQYKDGGSNDSIRYSCSPDIFSVRPAGFRVDGLQKMTGGMEYSKKIVAFPYNNNISTVSTYNQDMGIVAISDDAMLTDFTDEANCDINRAVSSDDLSITNTGKFIQGESNLKIFYNNIGVIDTAILDNKWSSSDQVAKGDSMDCIKDSGDNEHSGEGKVGCNIELKTKLQFVPKDFSSMLNLNDYGVGYTYISSEAPMVAGAEITITARLNNDGTATNYHQNCYSKKVDYSLQLTDQTLAGWENRDNGVNASKPRSRISYFEIANVANSADINSQGNDDGKAELSVTQEKFTQGTAYPIVGFNFDRSENVTENPFVVKYEDFTVSDIKDADDIKGVTTVNGTGEEVHFYYARVHSRSYNTNLIRVALSDINYEVYCAGCAEGAYALITESNAVEIPAEWYINTLHRQSKDGNVSKFLTTEPNKAWVTPDSTSSISNGKEQNITAERAGNIATPYTTKVTMNTYSWLINSSTFDVVFGGGGGWAGYGAVGTEANASKVGRTVNRNTNSEESLQRRKLDW